MMGCFDNFVALLKTHYREQRAKFRLVGSNVDGGMAVAHGCRRVLGEKFRHNQATLRDATEPLEKRNEISAFTGNKSAPTVVRTDGAFFIYPSK